LRPVISRHFDGAAQGIHHTTKLDEQPVTGRLDEAAAVLGDFWVDEPAAQRFEALKGAGLVAPISRE
jgi:hypothetical protein